MSRRIALLITLIIVFIGMSDTTLKGQAKASETIYIRADGSVDPSTAAISSVDNFTYTFASDIEGFIEVQRNNIIIDGNGFALTGSGYGNGFYLYGVSNVTIKGAIIQGFNMGIQSHRIVNSTICGNMIKDNKYGISFTSSLNNAIVGNVIMQNNRSGIDFQFVNGTTISGNNITDNYDGIYFDEAHGNTVNGNIIVASNYYGILVYLSFDNSISGNIIETSNYYGIHLESCSGTHIAENRITNNTYDGIGLYKSSSNAIIGNNISTNRDDGINLLNSMENKILENYVTLNNDGGISLVLSSNNTLNGNKITKNKNNGIGLSISSRNNISGNTVSDNDNGILLNSSFNNSIYHNNFVDNTCQWLSHGSTNILDNGIEGNYWSNYTGVDSDHNAIGDLPQILDANNQDNYPLMGIFHSFNASSSYYVDIVSNSTIDDFEYFESSGTIKMYVSDITANQTFGFCRMCIPKDLMSPPYTVVIDDGLTEVLYFNGTIYANGTHIWIYFAYEHSNHEVAIIPAYRNHYSLFMIATLFMMATLLAVIVYRKKRVR